MKKISIYVTEKDKNAALLPVYNKMSNVIIYKKK